MPFTPDEQRRRNREKRRRHYRKHREEIRANRRAPPRAKPAPDLETLKRRVAKKRSYKKNQPSERLRREAEAARPRPTCCDVCGDERRIQLDHCHRRGIFRGWLCGNCNSILGLAYDDPDRLRKLIAYLERTSILVPPQLTLPGI